MTKKQQTNSPTLPSDKNKVEKFLDGKTKFDALAFKRLVLTELSYNGSIVNARICGYTKEQIDNMAKNPEKHGKQILKLSNFMYLKSGYYKRLINYFVNLPKGECWTVDTEIKNIKYSEVEPKVIKKNYINYISQCNSFKLEYELPKILLNVFLYDACFGYLVETDTDNFIYYFQPEYCDIIGSANGIPMYGLRVNQIKNSDLSNYPIEIQNLIVNGVADTYGRVTIPYEKSICIKYHELFSYLYPPLFMLIKEILNIEDYKALEKTKVENEIYKILALKIPTNDDGELAVGDDIVTPFTTLANDIVSQSVGILPSPFEVTPIEFDNSSTNSINNVQNAIDEAYSETGVSKALMSGSTSGSELQISIEVDASDIYRLLKQVSKLVNFHCKVRGGMYQSYGFSFRYLDITALNQKDKINLALQLSQASTPNKFEMMATTGVNPTRLLGNDFMENSVFEIGKTWTVLQSSYTTSGDKESEGGAPELDTGDISSAGETTRENDTNNPDNRV